MKSKFILFSFMFTSFLFAQKTEINNKAKIDSIVTSLNQWYIDELDLYERPAAYSNDRITSGETNAWIITHKERLKELGAEVFWDGKNKKYFLKPE